MMPLYPLEGSTLAKTYGGVSACPGPAAVCPLTRKVSASPEFEIHLTVSAVSRCISEQLHLRLAPVEYVRVPVLLCGGLQTESVGTGIGLRKTERPNLRLAGLEHQGSRLTLLVARSGSHLFLISSLPYSLKTVLTRVLCTSTRTATLGSTRASSSTAMMAEVNEHSDPEWSAEVSMPIS